MKLTRRKQLLGLGMITLGGGAIVGTNAFSTVEADRTISLSTSGDDTAIVQISVNESSGLADTGGGTAGLNLDKINKNGKTTFEDALDVTVNDTTTAADSYTISIVEDVDRVSFSPSKYTDVDAGTTVSFDLEVNLLPDQAQASDVPSDAEFTVKVENTA